jgi:hypothetical protein
MKQKLLRLKLSAIIFLISLPACAQKDLSAYSDFIPPHPRILLLGGEEALLRQTIETDEAWKKIDLFIIYESDKLIDKPPVERVLIGRRLLDKSREALARVFYLSYSWRMTSDLKFFKRAEKELLAISAFTDWNPSHFLDVAEMTMAAAIGYDWLYNELSVESREIIKNAIIEKGLKQSLDSKYNNWAKSTNNWNQVCNAGMTYGALAVFEDEKVLASKIIDRAVSSIQLPMGDYNPDGAYPEGYSYWGYGTSFNIMFLAAIEKAFGKGINPPLNDGFMKTASYLEHMTGAAGNCFNYSDCGSGTGLHPAMFWFANQTEDPTLLWMEFGYLKKKSVSRDRMLPALLVWCAGIKTENITPPDELLWVGQGKNPVALMRSSWSDPNAIYVGIKGGSPSVNHAHMDVGSFVMDANGVRWAMDFGMQDYNSLESAGVSLWGMGQTSQRWQVFRYNNLVHNTLTVNNQHQIAGGTALITSYSDNREMVNAVTDISSVYTGTLKKAVRGIAIVGNKYVTVRDEIETLASETIVRWNLLTSAEVTITGNNSAELVKNGKKLLLKVSEPATVTMKTWSTVPPNSYDAPNPGTIMIGFEAVIPANSQTVLSVQLIPESAQETATVPALKLSDWPSDK